MSKNKRLAGNALLVLGGLMLLSSFAVVGGLVSWDSSDGSRSTFLLQGVALWVANALVLYGAYQLRGDGNKNKDFF